MRSVLFVAYDFPPGPGIGAGLRSASFVHYLPAFGWQPRVLALDGGQPRDDDVERLASTTPWQRPYEVTPYGWAHALRRRLRRTDDPVCDLVYVSCPPFPQALPAAAFARRRGIPLVVDFRDAWSLDPYQEGSRLKRLLYRHLFPRLEGRLLARTELLLLNTPSALSAYRAAYPALASRMAWLPNGYDERAFAVQPEEPSDAAGDLRLLYAGRFGIGARAPENLLAALRDVRTRGCAVRCDIVGRQPPAVIARLRGAVADGVVRLIDEVSYRAAVAQMCAADVLVLIQAPSPAAVQAVAGKTYDYLRSGRPILAIVPPGDNLDLVREHAAAHVHVADDAGAIADAIERLHRQWCNGELPRAQRVSQTYAGRFERRALAARLAAHFDRLVGDHR
ncbi:MAG: glycosyltransferase [Gammaproteobacteria bacterium]|nr:glycosyltransferase [Gammaproteobacteria bacterium]